MSVVLGLAVLAAFVAIALRVRAARKRDGGSAGSTGSGGSGGAGKDAPKKEQER